MQDPKQKYLGSKNGAGIYQAIIAAMPPHDVYIEPFAGSGAILRRKPPALRSVAVDLDESVFSRFYDGVECEKVSGCGIEYIEAFDCTAGRVLAYLDPPYPLEVRRSPRYKFDMDNNDQKRVIDAALSFEGDVIISSYPNPAYEEAFSGWRSMEMQTRTHVATVTEKIWMNYEAGKPFWHTHAGKDRTDRQRIKRMAESWGRKYEGLSAGERLAVLNSVLNVHADNRRQRS